MNEGIFEPVVKFPDESAAEVFASLVGLDEVKRALVTECRIRLDPSVLSNWSEKHHRVEIAAVGVMRRRPPLFVLAGDVGTGKSALARSFGHEVFRESRVPIELHAMSLTARGTGAVGEMTRLISQAFSVVRERFVTSRRTSGKAARGGILLIDEADALAQSRESAQMHHEDRAGVNALIRGIDEVAASEAPVVILMCTNRVDALDPAVMRRAARVFQFTRPSREQRAAVLAGALGGALGDQEIAALASATGSESGSNSGFSYSDLTQRLVPALVLEAVAADGRIEGGRALEIAAAMPPTPAFTAEEAV